MILELRNIKKTFTQGEHKISVLTDVSLFLDRPTTVSLIGPSGSGKSTLLTIATGLENPDSGDVLWMGNNIVGLPSEKLARLRSDTLGIVFQQFHLFPHLSAIENVELPLRLKGDDSARKKADEALQMVGLSHRLKHYPHQLSRGECQRVAIARVLSIRPKIIFADEPTGSLDQKNAAEVLELLFRLSKEAMALLVLITHDLSLAKRCEKHFAIQGGTLVPVDTYLTDQEPKQR